MESCKREITLLSLGQDPCELGLRHISSVLKRNGFVVNKLFLKQRLEEDIPVKTIKQITRFAKDSLFIGISIMTDNVILAKNMAKKIKGLNKDLILVGGGIHPTVRPNEIIDVFDIAVRGEAEESILILADELYKGKRVKDIRVPTVSTNYYNSNEFGFIRDVDILPYPDFSDNFIIKKGQIYLEKDYQALIGDHYPVLTSRGCPYECTYCENNFYSENIDRHFFRKRSIGKIIDELRLAKERYRIKKIAFLSDNFLSFNDGELEDFASLYEKEINLPFICCTAPNCIKESHIAKLTKIGLFRVALGIESGSENTLNLYKRRHGSPQRIVEAARILHKFYPGLSYCFDLILDNPYETKEDLMKTMSLLEALPRTYGLTLFSLTFYPGTYLYNKAVEDGIIEDSYYLKKSKYLHKLNKSFYNSIFLLYALKANQKLIAYLIRCESRENIASGICRTVVKNLTNVLLGVCLLKMIMRFIHSKNRNFVYHYIKLGFSVIKSSLLHR